MQFGAYELRKESDARHNKAMIVVIIIIAIAFLLPLLVNTVLPKAEERPEDVTEQALVSLDNATEDQEEEEDEPEQERYEEEVEQVLPEEVLNTVKVTEIAIVEDDKMKAEDEVKSADDLAATTTAFGQSDFDKGTDDRNVVREHKDEIVVEEKEAC